MKLIDDLFDGPLDIVGDIHGEIEALEHLLAELGYPADGSHPEDRRLVFLGDLVDRGPDSPAVLERVMALVAAGRAQCILGNHELNLMRDVEKYGNTWWVDPDKDTEHPAARVSPEKKARFQAFLEKLPLAGERHDLRVVHASWNAEAIAKLRADEAASTDVVQAYYKYFGALRDRWRGGALSKAYREEWELYGKHLTDPHWDPVLMPARAQMDAEFQMENPVVVLTSGEETPTDTPFWAGGKWRMVDRVKWWDHYDDPVPVIIGHYWRRYSEAGLVLKDKFGPDLFEGIEPHHWMGKRSNVYCVDFSVGARPAQRAADQPTHICKLAALRVPEWEVMHDDGELWPIGPPGRLA